MAKPPAFQFYAADWLASPNVTLMTPAERGGYIQLLAYCWVSGDCSLPDDDSKLSALTDLDSSAIVAIRKCFIAHPMKNGAITNEKMLKQWVQLNEYRNERVASGLKGAKKRWKKRGSVKDGSAMAQPSSKNSSAINQPLANDSSSSSSSLVSLTEILFSRFWKEYPLKVGKQNAVKSFQKCCPDETTLESILAGVDRWRKSQQWTRDAGKYIHHPATFLNQRRWEEFPTPDVLKPPPKPIEKLDIVDGKPPPGWDEPIPPWQPPKKPTGGAS